MILIPRKGFSFIKRPLQLFDRNQISKKPEIILSGFLLAFFTYSSSYWRSLSLWIYIQRSWPFFPDILTAG